MKNFIFLFLFCSLDSLAYSVHGPGMEYEIMHEKKRVIFHSETMHFEQELNSCSEKNLLPLLKRLKTMMDKSYPKKLMNITMTENKKSAEIPLDSEDGNRLMNMEMKIRQVKKLCY